MRGPRTYPRSRRRCTALRPLLGATLTPGDIAIERAGDAAERLDGYHEARCDRDLDDILGGAPHQSLACNYSPGQACAIHED